MAFWVDWPLWEKLSFALAILIILVIIYGCCVLMYSRWRIRRYAAIEARQKEEEAELYPMLKRDDIPFGARALERGIQVPGIWISSPDTPSPSPQPPGTPAIRSRSASPAPRPPSPAPRPVPVRVRPINRPVPASYDDPVPSPVAVRRYARSPVTQSHSNIPGPSMYSPSALHVDPALSPVHVPRYARPPVTQFHSDITEPSMYSPSELHVDPALSPVAVRRYARPPVTQSHSDITGPGMYSPSALHDDPVLSPVAAPRYARPPVLQSNRHITRPNMQRYECYRPRAIHPSLTIASAPVTSSSLNRRSEAFGSHEKRASFHKRVLRASQLFDSKRSRSGTSEQEEFDLGSPSYEHDFRPQDEKQRGSGIHKGTLRRRSSEEFRRKMSQIFNDKIHMNMPAERLQFDPTLRETKRRKFRTSVLSHFQS